MSLCNVCKYIPFRNIIDHDGEAIENDGFRFNSIGRTSPTFSDHLPWNMRRCTVLELVSRAKTCRLCEFILLIVKDTTWVNGDTIESVTWEEAKTTISRNLMIRMALVAIQGYNPGILISLDSPHEEKTQSLVLEFRKSLDSSLKSPLNRVVFRETLHPNTLNIMLSWLDECNNNHPRCSHLSTRVVPLPTRVLDVSALPELGKVLERCYDWRELWQGRNCKLVQTLHGQTGRYAALSYCWGTSLPSTTTTANLQAHESGISFDTLPRTLQDAILVVRWMGIEYIWIDCLCILQDSKIDWEHEAARMADVYSNAYLTIAASRAEHCGEGFLGLRAVSFLLCIDIEDDNGSFELYFQPPSTLTNEHSQPLDRRAWAVQEALLSHRVLRFDFERMTWGCDEFYGTEDGHTKPAGRIGARQIEEITESLWQHTYHEFASDHWAQFVESYSACQVTYETDTFPAISGVVRKIQQATGDIYYAGLWKEHFLGGLLWSPKTDLRPYNNNSVVEPSGKPKRRQQWVAPSWSWASTKGVIEYQPIDYYTYCARLEECRVTYSGLDPFGALTTGFARLTGPVTSITAVGSDTMIQLRNGTLAEAIIKFDFAEFDFVKNGSCGALMITPHQGICIEKVGQSTARFSAKLDQLLRRPAERLFKKAMPSVALETYLRIGILDLKPVNRSMNFTARDHVKPCSIILM